MRLLRDFASKPKRQKGRCRTCRWWENVESVQFDGYQGEYLRGSCQKVSTMDEGGPETDGAFETGPDFGCVLWEARE